MQFGFEVLDSRLAKWVGVKLTAWRQGAGSWGGGGNPWENRSIGSQFWIPGRGDKNVNPGVLIGGKEEGGIDIFLWQIYWFLAKS